MTDPAPAAAGAAEAAWLQWHARCALARCDAEPAGILRHFAWTRSVSLIHRLGTLAEGLAVPAAREAWHLFEVHLVTGRTREGKRYKEWLFARSAGQTGPARLDTIQGGATLILRDVVRETIRREVRPFGTCSIDAPIHGTEGLTLADLVAGGSSPADDAAAREIEVLAQRTAERIFGTASRRVRIGLCLRELGLSLDGPAVERAAGCGKSSLHSAVRIFTTGLAVAVCHAHPSETPDTAHAIAARAMQILRERAREWGRLEKSLARFFLQVEGTSYAAAAHLREKPS